MMRPVSFEQFGSSDILLYRQYLNTFWAEVQLERDEFQVFGAELQRQWKGSRGDVVGIGSPDRAGRRAAIQRAVSWRPGFGGESVGQGGADRTAVGVGAEPAGVSVGGSGRGDAGGVGDGSGCDGAVGCGDREASDASTGGVGSADGAGGSGVGTRDGQRESADLDTGVVRGRWYEKNKAKRERRKARKEDGVGKNGREVRTLVSVRAAHPKLDDTWAQRKIRENEMAIARMDAQMAKMKREQEDGTAEKRYKVEANLVQGQLDGAFALVPQQRVVSWAKTIDSRATSSGSGSAGKKSVASIPSVSSGLGASSATSMTVEEQRLAKEVASLRRQLAEEKKNAKARCEAFEETELRKRLDLNKSAGDRIDELKRELQRKDSLMFRYVQQHKLQSLV